MEEKKYTKEEVIGIVQAILDDYLAENFVTSYSWDMHHVDSIEYVGFYGNKAKAEAYGQFMIGQEIIEKLKTELSK